MHTQKARLSQLADKWFQRVPDSMKADFALDNLRKNVSRFSFLPYFNLFTQLCCVFIYLYMYPTVFPEKPALDPVFFLSFTAVYCAVNVIGAVKLFRLRSGAAENIARSTRAVDLFLLSYVILESSQVAFELEIYGNLYRFLATFFVVSFFPILPRGKRFAFMLAYVVISQGWLAYLRNVRQIPVYSYPQIIIAFFIACIIASNINYNGVIKHYVLHTSLLEKNRQLSELNEKLERLSATDSLTGMTNRRALSSYANTCWKNSLRTGHPLNFIMIDIDNFKKYNDTYGHQAGDDCLRLVSACIRRSFHRDTDMTARYGGEEFAVLLPHTSAENSIMLAERVRAAVEALDICHENNAGFGHVTVSAGVASKVPEVGESYESLIDYADQALYQAKAAGRNLVCVWAGPEAVSTATEG